METCRNRKSSVREKVINSRIKIEKISVSEQFINNYKVSGNPTCEGKYKVLRLHYICTCSELVHTSNNRRSFKSACWGEDERKNHLKGPWLQWDGGM